MARDPKLFMWAGGKSKMIKHYADHLPVTLPEGGYAEPFAGGAALFAHLRRTRPHAPAALGDVNAEGMGLYAEVRDAPDRLLGNARPYADAWAAAGPEERRRLYYATREAYWGMGAGPEATATLYVLMRTGFNGIWQTCAASRGKFGTPVASWTSESRCSMRPPCVPGPGICVARHFTRGRSRRWRPPRGPSCSATRPTGTRSRHTAPASMTEPRGGWCGGAETSRRRGAAWCGWPTGTRGTGSTPQA